MEESKILKAIKYTLSDAEIVDRVVAGEKELYEILMRRYNKSLYRAIRSYLNDNDEVKDAMQDTYLKAYTKLYQFHGKAQFSTWLIRIGINEALGRLREKGRIATLFSSEDETDMIFQLVDKKQPDPENKIIQTEVKQIIEQAIDELPPKYKSVYVLKEVEEMSHSEIAACLDISESNVKVRLHRAKLLLKEALYEFAIGTELFEFGSKSCDSLVEAVMIQIT